jgi:signal transduction histidine kinase
LVEAERSAALGQISAKIYHEIRNPILSIGGLARRLLKKPGGENSQKFLEVIAKEAGRLESVLANLFNYTKTANFTPAPTDLVALTKSVIDLLQSDLDRLRITAAFAVVGEIPPILIDREQIHLALVHILKNSIEAMPHGGNLVLTAGRRKESVTLSIRDSGAGILPGHITRVTEPFFTTKVYGTGLGLSLAQKAIDLHAGSLTFVQPEVNGTEVIVELPAPAP